MWLDITCQSLSRQPLDIKKPAGVAPTGLSRIRIADIGKLGSDLVLLNHPWLRLGIACEPLPRLGAMPELTRQTKITFGEMRSSGVRGVLVYCSDYKYSHSTASSGDRWPDDVRLSDIEPLFTCRACGKRGGDVRPDFH